MTAEKDIARVAGLKILYRIAHGPHPANANEALAEVEQIIRAELAPLLRAVDAVLDDVLLERGDKIDRGGPDFSVCPACIDDLRAALEGGPRDG